MTLQELLARVEKAERPDRELDTEIFWRLVNNQYANEGDYGWRKWRDAKEAAKTARPGEFDDWADHNEYACYTASIDAAVALVERMLPGWMGEVCFGKSGDQDGRFGATLEHYHMPPYGVLGDGATPALALIAALLKALIAK